MCYSRKKKMKLTRHLKLDWSFQWGSGKAHRAGNAHSVSDSAAEELASQAGGVGSEPWVIFTFFPFSFFFFPWLYTQISYLCSSRTFFSVQCLANTFKAKPAVFRIHSPSFQAFLLVSTTSFAAFSLHDLFSLIHVMSPSNNLFSFLPSYT